jgi:membrane-associated phospholipid phosphatase
LYTAAWLILIDIAGIWFSAVYSNHHYLIDVLLGLACAITGIFIFEKFIRKEAFEDLISKYLRFIN